MRGEVWMMAGNIALARERVMKTLINYLAVGGAGCLGAMSRYFVATTCARLFGTAFPVGTFVINITGSFFLGWFMTMIGQRMPVSDTTRVAIAVGFVGAYTTFSSLMYESDSLVRGGEGLKAIANLVGSLLVGLLAIRLGMALAGARS
jgi:fluoride exporter